MNLSGAAATIANVTLRALLGRRRTLLMLLVAGAPVLLGLIVRANGPRPESLVGALDGLIITSVLPLVALIFGTTARGSELDDGTAVHILTKPIPRWVIVVPKLVVAAGLTALMIVPSTILAGILIGGIGSRELGITFAFAGGENGTPVGSTVLRAAGVTGSTCSMPRAYGARGYDGWNGWCTK